jgi:hypothetical protein
MIDYRASYRKTVVLAAAAAGACLILATAWGQVSTRLFAELPPVFGRLATWLPIVVLLAGAAFAALVSLGGVFALRDDWRRNSDCGATRCNGGVAREA